jgi:hypothetical protein
MNVLWRILAPKQGGGLGWLVMQMKIHAQQKKYSMVRAEAQRRSEDF